MKLIRSRIFRFTFVTAILATLAILFLRGRDPSFLSFHRPSVGEAAMDREIDELDFEVLPIAQAVALISQKAGVRIAVEDGALDGDADTVITLHVHRAGLGAILDDVCRQAYRRVDYFPTPDGVEISTMPGGASPCYLDVCDLRKTVSRGPMPASQTKQEPGDYTVTIREYPEILRCISRSRAVGKLPQRPRRASFGRCFRTASILASPFDRWADSSRSALAIGCP
jgi:hypothetical protein